MVQAVSGSVCVSVCVFVHGCVLVCMRMFVCACCQGGVGLGIEHARY